MEGGGTSDGALRADLRELQLQLDVLRRRLDATRGREALPEGPFALLVCRVGHDRVGLALDAVETVVPLPMLAPLPEADYDVPGVLDLRGTFVPVLDALARFERRRRPVSLGDLVVVCRSNERPLGLIVQEVAGILQTDAGRIQDGGGELPHAAYVLGIVRDDDAPVLVLSIERLVTLVPEAEPDAEREP